MQKDVSTQNPNFVAPMTDAATDSPKKIYAVINEKLRMESFRQLSGIMANIPFVKIVVDTETNAVHFIRHSKYQFHADYIGEQILGMKEKEIRNNIDYWNKQFYKTDNRRFYLGILSLHSNRKGFYFTLETVEVDNMNQRALESFYGAVVSYIDPTVLVALKPASHEQEAIVSMIDKSRVPRIMNHELFTDSNYYALNEGSTKGRIRIFESKEKYKAAVNTIEWFDIIVMDKVPDSIPRVAGIINSSHTTPLSHTNVLAHGWGVPNAVEIGVINRLKEEGLNHTWVELEVTSSGGMVNIKKVDLDESKVEKPHWTIHKVHMAEPETDRAPIARLEDLRLSDQIRYGTKAANLGELKYLLKEGSRKILGYYRVPRPPRENLMEYIHQKFETKTTEEAERKTMDFLRKTVVVPKGIALPFCLQKEFLESSPAVQQTIGKLKMALELNAKEIDSICVQLQNRIRQTKMPNSLYDYIDSYIASHLCGVEEFVVRSSSNAEDLEDFSAAGIYESVTHVATADNLFKAIKEVWASLVSPRSVRLRRDVGIPIEDCYMGVIIQEQINTPIGGVMVTTNPSNPKDDFRNIYINASKETVESVVEGVTLPFQYLFNTVEGGGKTMSIGNASEDLSLGVRAILQDLAYCGRFLQAHFSKDYLFKDPVDIEWATDGKKIFMLQLRPYKV